MTSEKLIIWTEAYRIDNAIIDEQHQQLIQIINELYAAFLHGKAHYIVEKIIDDLFQYTIFHFGTEERLLQRINFPYFSAHLQEHKKFIERVEAFKNGISRSETVLTYEVMNFLRDWLQTHILGSDKKYAPFL